MKKLGILFSIFMLLTAFTCENEPLEGDFVSEEIDNNDNNNNNASLVGTWALVEFNADITSTTTFDGGEFVLDFSTELVSADYNLVFTETDYTVSGDYELMSTTIVNGELNDSYTDAYTDVFGEGVYSTNGNVMTINGSFLDFEVDGMPAAVDDVDQDADFTLSADGQTLTFFQDEEQLQEDNNLDASTVINSSSVWQKLE
ncbi:hypothetical protein [Psychroserpens jangbogonensis]|uniref:hypothetical protein n=1 Tax=Psychroserpens jangbogonensis TaxID=1484460 RepID=UPI00053EBF9B|nr:hypothetical protein [Psychroserpens jangbogonensis]